MTDFKPTASLSSGLLARKGTARPAMRRQFPSSFGSSSTPSASIDADDLGWNDMGEDQPPHAACPPSPQLPDPADNVQAPAVMQQREALHEAYSRSIRFGSAPDVQAESLEDAEDDANDETDVTSSAAHRANAAPDPSERVSLLTMSQRSPTFYRGGRERSFTLRMSEARHAQLRDICVNRNCSAQLFVTQAIDHYVAEITKLAKSA